MSIAIDLAQQWWTAAAGVIQVVPNDRAVHDFLAWLRLHRLGRKRLLDTLLAATYREQRISTILTTNTADFKIFGCFRCITP